MKIKFIQPSTITIMVTIFLSYGVITAQAYETTDLVKGCANKYAGYDAAIDVCSLHIEHGKQLVTEKWSADDIEMKCAVFAASKSREIITEDAARKEKLQQSEKTMGKRFGINMRAMKLWVMTNYPDDYASANKHKKDKSLWVNQMIQPAKAIGLCKRIAKIAGQRFAPASQ